MCFVFYCRGFIIRFFSQSSSNSIHPLQSLAFKSSINSILFICIIHVSFVVVPSLIFCFSPFHTKPAQSTSAKCPTQTARTAIIRQRFAATATAVLGKLHTPCRLRNSIQIRRAESDAKTIRICAVQVWRTILKKLQDLHQTATNNNTTTQ